MEPGIMEDIFKNSGEVNAVFPLTSTQEKCVSEVLPHMNSNVDEILNLRKKKKNFRLSSFQEYVSNVERSSGSKDFDSFSVVSAESTQDDELDKMFDFSRKKKKKSSRKIEEELVKNNSKEESEIVDEKPAVLHESPTFAGISDYTYEYLLSRFYSLAVSGSPRIDQDFNMKIILKPPQVIRVGSKKTLFANFSEICRSLHRPPQHFISYIFAELGTCGSVDGDNHLLIRGRFQQNQISNIIRRYVLEYVKCATCNSMSTFIQKRIRLHFVICESCNSQRSVVSIKSGFQALTDKRSALRAKTTT